MRTRRNKAFTLVEILIVVVIIGILAAIVVPQFANATKDSQAGNLKAQIKEIESQLELYKARNGAYPTVAALNDTSDANYPNGWAPMISGGYLKAAPRNPTITDSAHFYDLSAGTKQADGNVDGDQTTGWAYDETSGWFGANNFDEAAGTVRTGK